MRKMAWLLAVALVVPVVAQDVDEQAQEQDRFERLRRQVAQMIAGLRQFQDWETHYDFTVDAIERVYERNNWTSEPDLFSLEVLREVNAVPPWQVQERFDRLMNIMGDRYLLNERQTRVMRNMLLQENLRLFQRHSDRIMEYGMDAIRTRAAGEPFTPEQVAHWAELAKPVFEDARRSMNERAEQFMEVLDPEQRDLLRADLQAANNRLDVVQEMAGRWQRGEWRAEDWGLEDDPIQRGEYASANRQPAPQPEPPGNEAARAAEQAGGGAPAPAEQPVAARRAQRPQPPERRPVVQQPTGPAETPVRPAPQQPVKGKPDDDEWAKYVRAFIAKYKLNDEQEQRAWLFYKDAKARGEVATKRYERQVGDLGDSEDERVKAKVQELKQRKDHDMSRLFERLKTRLESLPTRAQRKAAEAEPERGKSSSENKP